MRIKAITLRNFRTFGTDHPPFEFADRMTVIAGINGRGKTAILDAIRILAGRLLPQISDAKGGYVRVTKYDIHRGAEAFELSMNCNCGGVPITNFKTQYDLHTMKLKRSAINRVARNEIRKRYRDPVDPNDAGSLVVSYTTDRAAFRLPRSVPPSAVDPPVAGYRGALSNRTVDYRDLAYRLKQLSAADAYPHFPGLADRMRRALHRVLQSFLEGFDNLRVNETPLGLQVDKLGSTLEVFQLSDGERAFLAMGTDLARRLTLANPRLEDPLQGGGVVLIDELELHLHPRWQRTSVEKLRTTFPNIQFIASTHSPFVIQTLRPRELISLEDRERDSYAGLGIEEISKAVMGLEQLQVSPRYQEMLDVAREYFAILDGAAEVSREQKAALKRKLQEMTAPYADNPAYQAFLEQQRFAAGVD